MCIIVTSSMILEDTVDLFCMFCVMCVVSIVCMPYNIRIPLVQ